MSRFGGLFRSGLMNIVKFSALLRSPVGIGLVGGVTTAHACYAYGTKVDETITVSSKYQLNDNGMSLLMVTDDKGVHYRVPNSVWYWQWDAPERWEQLTVGESYDVTRYGWRVQALGLFPNV